MPLIRARDLRANIKDHGFEQGVVMTLERALDEMAEIRQHTRELTDMVARCVDTIGVLTQAGDGLKRMIEEMQRVHQQGEDDGEHR